MRTKTVLSVAAALAVGATLAQAQVYSVNIVGYVNDANTGGNLTLIQNPLDNGTNTLNTVLAGSPADSVAYVWNGTGYTPSFVGAKTGTWDPDLSIPPGVGFFFKPTTDHTNTYVGEVVAAPGESVTNALPGGILDLTGALIPLATTSIATDTAFGLANAPGDSVLYKWNGTGYTPSFVGAKTGTWDPDVAVGVGEAVFVKPAADFDWVQTLPAN